jgi:hypothetical protein
VTLGAVADDLALAALTMARRFATGATLWCWAPSAPAHAHHVAVEFVHPVIVGKRALPAVAIVDHDAAAALRPVVRAGDLLLAVAGAEDRHVADTMRRAGAWGVTTMWIGPGERPPAGAADHVLWLDDGDLLAVHDGRLVLVYHLLWELTHVCFEHPGLLRAEPPGDEPPACTTCSDEGRLGEVVGTTADTTTADTTTADTTDAKRAMATVRTAAGVEAVDTTLVGPVHPGDLVLVHAGAAITIVDDLG